ncbi:MULTISPECIES: protease inhibitor I42 family protein [Dickeya]|uniref:protease inhibitor I42 family protein n=1 Tax=Dickeya TaxID=204037 RepID=UPI001EE63924|nr:MULTISPECIES: protease inhibitor I42 family protein [Dickeya]WKV51387.1 protease inhibitor I42 family protein [Dickeya fangzhongdai]
MASITTCRCKNMGHNHQYAGRILLYSRLSLENFMKRFAFAVGLMFPLSVMAATAVDNQHKETKVGEQFEVTLPANPSTGYTWAIKKLPDVVVLTGKTYKPGADCHDKVGCGGHEMFHFKAVKAGEGEIDLSYARPWEKQPQPDDKEAVIKVTVK